MEKSQILTFKPVLEFLDPGEVARLALVSADINKNLIKHKAIEFSIYHADMPKQLRPKYWEKMCKFTL